MSFVTSLAACQFLKSRETLTKAPKKHEEALALLLLYLFQY